jgi:hypothetical protein
MYEGLRIARPVMGIIVSSFIIFYILFKNFLINVSSVAFVRFRKISISDYKLRHVHLSVRTEQFGSHKYEIWYLNIFQKSSEKIHVYYF